MQVTLRTLAATLLSALMTMLLAPSAGAVSATENAVYNLLAIFR